jgi:hypothetical protein
VRIWDIRDPFAVYEIGYFVPPANKNTVPTCKNAETKEGGEFGTPTGPDSCKAAAVTNTSRLTIAATSTLRSHRQRASHPEADRLCAADRLEDDADQRCGGDEGRLEAGKLIDELPRCRRTE